MSLILNDIRFIYDGRDLSGDGNSISISETFPMHEATRLTDTAKINRPGFPEGKFSYAGYSKFGAGLVEETISSHKGLNVAMLAAKSGNAGDRCHFWQAVQATLDPVRGKAGEILGFTIDGMTAGDGGIIDGTIVEDGKTLRTTSANGGAWQLGAVGATQRLYAIVHLLSIDAGNVTVRIESDNSGAMSSPVIQYTFAAQTTVSGLYMISIPGPITDDWWRAAWTAAGGAASFAQLVAIGIR